MELKPGVRVGADLRLVRLLGSGAMGEVWEAVRSEGDRVAVKFASRHLLRDATERGRFSREAKLAHQLQSAHVVRSMGHGILDNGQPYIVMELLKGETLEDRLRRDKVIGARELTRILRQVAAALDEAHSLGIIHRDVKPANVFMVAGKSEVRTKMLDFGMAKRTGISNPSVVTEAGTSVGTPDYMSPEQLRTAQDVDHRSDLWALGVLAYRALLGRLPFESTTFAGLCMAICEGRYTQPSELASFLGDSVDHWFERALAVDREQRFHSADEMVETLERALAIDTVPPPPRLEPAVESKPQQAAASRPRAPEASRRGGHADLGVEDSSPAEPAPAHRWLNVAIALMLSIAALCGGALLASIDGF